MKITITREIPNEILYKVLAKVFSFGEETKPSEEDAINIIKDKGSSVIDSAIAEVIAEEELLKVQPDIDVKLAQKQQAVQARIDQLNKP